MEKDLTHRHGNECGIIAVRSVKVASTSASSEDSNGLIIFDWEIAKETYKADFVIDLVERETLAKSKMHLQTGSIPSIQVWPTWLLQ